MCGQVTTNATTHATKAPPDRTGAPVEVAKTTRVIVDGIRDVANIRGITMAIVEVTPVTGLAVATLPLAVGEDLMTQIGPLNQPILVETNPTRIIWSIKNTGKTENPQVHAGAGMRSNRTNMNINTVY